MKATEQPIPMNLTLNITADPQIIEAINNLSAAIANRAAPSFSVTLPPGGSGGSTRSSVEQAVGGLGGCGTFIREPEPQVIPEPVIFEAPKKRAAKKTEPEPVADTPEPETPAASEPEPEFAFTGDNLADMVKPFSGTEVTKKLKAFKNETLGVETELRKITDTEVLRKLHAKIEELIAAHKAGDEV